MRVNLPRAIVLYFVWLGFISGVLLVAMGDVLPFRVAFITPENAFTCLIEAELFFVLVAWPFFIPRLLVPRVTMSTGVSGEGHLLILQVLVLFMVALPLAFLCQNVANVGPKEFFTGHLLVATAACFVAALFGSGAERQRLAPWYFLGFFVVSAMLPFMHYLSVEYAGTSLRFLSAVSPFWGAAQLEGAVPLVSSGLFVLGALALFVAGAVVGKPAGTPAAQS